MVLMRWPRHYPKECSMRKTHKLFVLVALFFFLCQPCLTAQSKSVNMAAFGITKLAFVVNRGTSITPGLVNTEIVVIDVSSGTSKPKMIAQGDEPAWSPDGSELACCVRDGSGFGQIQIMKADGS